MCKTNIKICFINIILVSNGWSRFYKTVKIIYYTYILSQLKIKKILNNIFVTIKMRLLVS